jgi:hypothetical protein
VRVVLVNLAETFSGPFPRARVGCDHSADPVGSPNEIHDGSSRGRIRRAGEKFGRYDGGEVGARECLLQHPKGGAKEAASDGANVDPGFCALGAQKPNWRCKEFLARGFRTVSSRGRVKGGDSYRAWRNIPRNLDTGDAPA